MAMEPPSTQTAKAAKAQRAARHREIDALLNQTAVEIARQERLADAVIASWSKLAGAGPREKGSNDAVDVLDAHGLDGLAGREETVGLGFALATNPQGRGGTGSLTNGNGQSAGYLETLKKVYGIKNKQRTEHGTQSLRNGQASSFKRKNGAASEEDSEDDEAGRSSSFTSKRAKIVAGHESILTNGEPIAVENAAFLTATSGGENTNAEASQTYEEWNGFSSDNEKEDDDAFHKTERNSSSLPMQAKDLAVSKQQKSYLDEILSERAAKSRKRRRRKKRKKSSNEQNV